MATNHSNKIYLTTYDIKNMMTEAVSLLFERHGNGYWTKDKCREAALECTSKSEFLRKYCSAYDASLKNGWLSEYTWFNKPTNKKTKNISLNELKSVIKNEVSNLLKELHYKDL